MQLSKWVVENAEAGKRFVDSIQSLDAWLPCTDRRLIARLKGRGFSAIPLWIGSDVTDTFHGRDALHFSFSIAFSIVSDDRLEDVVHVTFDPADCSAISTCGRASSSRKAKRPWTTAKASQLALVL